VSVVFVVMVAVSAVILVIAVVVSVVDGVLSVADGCDVGGGCGYNNGHWGKMRPSYLALP
jgi:hypothetical protein